MNKSEQLPYLDAGDSVLGPLGFKREKHGQEWQRSVGSESVDWIHLNFGISVINPSFGVRYIEIERLFNSSSKVSWGTMLMLSALTNKGYSTSDTSPQELAKHFLLAIPEIEKLRDRSAVIVRLESEERQKWPLAIGPLRMRLLPLLLAVSGRASEALNWVRRFESVAANQDQMVPDYSVFASDLRKHFNA